LSRSAKRRVLLGFPNDPLAKTVLGEFYIYMVKAKLIYWLVAYIQPNCSFLQQFSASVQFCLSILLANRNKTAVDNLGNRFCIFYATKATG